MRFRRLSSKATPLCAAGHLPHKGGDQQVAKAPANKIKGATPYRDNRERPAILLPISPLVGEMPGRAEGGNRPLGADTWEQSL